MARDRELDNPFARDAQITAIRGARAYRGDRLVRVARPHRLVDPRAGPLIAVRLSIRTRKTLGGLETDLSARVLRADGEPLSGLYAAGEVAGFGGGARLPALEGTFLGGCILSGHTARRRGEGAAYGCWLRFPRTAIFARRTQRRRCILTATDSRPLALPDGSVVHSDPEIHSGAPVFVGTRVPVQTFLDYLEGLRPQRVPRPFPQRAP